MVQKKSLMMKRQLERYMNNTIKHYWLWFRKIQKEYDTLTALMCFLYNGKYYTLEGEYKPEFTVEGMK